MMIDKNKTYVSFKENLHTHLFYILDNAVLQESIEIRQNICQK